MPKALIPHPHPPRSLSDTAHPKGAQPHTSLPTSHLQLSEQVLLLRRVRGRGQLGRRRGRLFEERPRLLRTNVAVRGLMTGAGADFGLRSGYELAGLVVGGVFVAVSVYWSFKGAAQILKQLMPSFSLS